MSRTKLFLGLSTLILLGAGCARGGGGGAPPSPPSGGQTGTSAGANLEACLAGCAPPLEKLCKSNCYTDKALAASDASYCDPLIGVGPHVSNVAGTGVDIGGFQYCINRFAQDKRAPDACDKLVSSGKFGEFDRYVCLSNVARRYQDPSVCGRLTDEIVQKPACLNAAGTAQ